MVDHRTTRTCFLITPIGEINSMHRIRADSLVCYLETVLSKFDLVLVRGDKISPVGNVINQVLQEILDSAVVIADLSWANPNVMYELGFADARGVPVFRIANSTTELPFNMQTDRVLALPSGEMGELLEPIPSESSDLLESFLTDSLEWGKKRRSMAEELIGNIGDKGLGEAGWARMVGGFTLGRGLNGLRRALSIAQADVERFDREFKSLLEKQPCNQYHIDILGAIIDDTAAINLRFGDWMESEIEVFVSKLVDLLIACRSPYEVHADQVGIRVKPGERVQRKTAD